MHFWSISFGCILALSFHLLNNEERLLLRDETNRTTRDIGFASL